MNFLPISNEPNQTFEVTLPQGGSNIPFRFYVSWNHIAGYWQMDITNLLENRKLVSGLSLVPGGEPAQNILKQFEYLGIGPAYVLPLSTATTDWPLLGDWGTNFVLAWGE